RYVNRFAIRARRAGPIERFRKWVKRHPGIAAALAVMVVAVVVAGYFGYRAHVAEEQRRAENEGHEKALRAARRQSALDRALLVAMSGDLGAAERAIADAELLGASTGQVRVLRGQVAYFRGDDLEAVQHLEQAVKLTPDNVAAWALLAAAQLGAGRMTEYI